MLSARRQFLEAFLGALGAVEILDYSESPTEARGTARLAADLEQLDLSGSDSDDVQEFCWQVTEDQAPPPLVYQLADVIHRFQLHGVDKLRVSRDTLFTVFLEDAGVPIKRADLAEALEALKAIHVSLEDEDEYFSIQE